LELAVERQTMVAWESFVSGDTLPTLPVSKVVLSSWQRSARAGVKPGTREAPLAFQGDRLEQLRRMSLDLMWAAKGLFINSAHLLERSGSIMMLTDQDGVVLEVAGDMRTRESGQDIHLVEGGHWHESVVGTNGIGTALAMRRPVQVHAAEHFCEGIKHWTCAAAPVFFPGTEQVLGVVDISGPPSTYQANNLVLAVAAARQIEAVLAERAGREHIYLLEACLKFGAAREVVAMIVLDRNAKIIHLSGALPGFDLRLGSSLPGLEAGRKVDEWARRLPDGLRPDWLHPVSVDGRTIGALLVVPTLSRGVTVATQQSVSLLSRRESGSEIDPLRHEFGNLVGNSSALRTATNRAQQLSGRRVSVLIHGETGVGKELFARAIHGDEARSGPFITFNCGATTKELIGSELFGHVRGAYTGATTDGRAGRFELAHGGTLCLDEIGDLPLELQPVLLRVLEEGVVCRLGEAKPRRVDVRLLAMTNRDLLKEVEAGHFRRDLYHRISVTNIRVPPLRERAGDIELLADHFNHRLAQRHGLMPRVFSPDVMAMLRAYAWPGNVREMRNVIESLLLTSNAELVQCEELPDEVLAAAGAGARASAASPATSLDEAERLAIVCAVESVHGNLTKAARALGVSRSTLYRKVERYHLESLAQLRDSVDQADYSRH
jgi:sigma-54 dependent transcriptional regulator, acetoin dehydrogenase operon transcriptional activator AcoR